jgi:hypothetical protein
MLFCTQADVRLISSDYFVSRVEASYNTRTVALRVVEGDGIQGVSKLLSGFPSSINGHEDNNLEPLYSWATFSRGGHKYRDLVLQIGGWTQG